MSKLVNLKELCLWDNRLISFSEEIKEWIERLESNNCNVTLSFDDIFKYN